MNINNKNKNNTSISRAEFRHQIRLKRAAITVAAQQVYATKLSHVLQQEICHFISANGKNASVTDADIDTGTDKPLKIALYLANDGELDPLPFIQWCWQQSLAQAIEVYLPVIHPFSKGNLLFLKYTPCTNMVKNKYGINEPKLNVQTVCLASDLHFIFTPLVAFDQTGNRLGMGGGFYDRTLAAIAANVINSNQPAVIGLAHHCQLVDSLPVETWDIPLPKIITPKKTFIF